VALAAGLLTACGRAPTSTSATVAPVPPGSSTQTITVGGISRSFIVYRPASLGSPAPLVLVLHGGYGSAQQAQNAYGWDAQADRDRFVVAYPDGIDHAWNAGGGCCGKPASEGIDDVAFITEVVATIGREIPVDSTRTFATGISNGGIMAYRLACETTLFAAIGPDSATMLGPCPSPAPLSVIAVHGTADARIPYNGGQGSGPARIDGPAVPALNATWRATDGCAPPVTSVAGAVTTSVATCPDGRAVELVTIAGAGQQWPGAPDRPVLQKLLGLDPPSTALDATAAIWAYFAAHPRPTT
jgi:polyhydroxybutyrate depolymerase